MRNDNRADVEDAARGDAQETKASGGAVAPLLVEHVTKRFRQGSQVVEALRDVSLTVHRGEFVAIMGASGSGKSTLLHAMAGLTDIDSGSIAVDGQDLARLNDSRLTRFRRERIGLVFQAYNLLPLLSAEDNIRLPVMEHRGSGDKVAALLDRLGLTDRRTHKPDALSGGEQQRVAIARALVTDPAILLVDEPTGNLDSVAGAEICALLRSLCQEQNRTIVMVTHEPSVALASDRVRVLKDGAIVAGFSTAGFSDALGLANAYQDAIRKAADSEGARHENRLEAHTRLLAATSGPHVAHDSGHHGSHLPGAVDGQRIRGARAVLRRVCAAGAGPLRAVGRPDQPMWAERVVIQSQAVKLQAPPPGSGSQPGEGVNECLLLGTDAPAPPFDLVRGRWIGENREGSGEPGTIDVALSVQIAERYDVGVGGTLIVGRDESSQPLRVVGIVGNPPVPITGRSAANMDLPSPSIAGIYARMEGAAAILKREPLATFVGVCLKDGVDVHAFRYAWGPRLGEFAEPAQFQEDHDLEEQLDEAAAAKNLKLQSYLATFMAMLLALLVIFNTLNMGVSERTRQFAMLRAIVLTRAQVAQLVFAESLFIAAVGFVGGLAAGQVLLGLADSLSSSVWRHGAHIGPLAIALAAFASFGAAMLAAFFPAWKATRVRPLDAMVPPQRTSASEAKRRGFWFLVGVVLVGLAPVLTFVFPPASEPEAKGRLIYGMLALAAGFLLLAPGIVRLVDRLAGPVLARAIGLCPKLLAQQVTCHTGRTVASAIGLSVGLTLYISIQVWGYTLLETFVPGEWVPDLQVSFEPYGLTDAAAVEVAHLPGIDAERCAAVVVEQPRLREDLTGSAARASVTRQDNVVMIGIDPAKAIGGDSPLLDFSYVRGTPGGALAAMRNDRGCIVPEHFLRETGLKVGDRFELVPPEDPKHPAAYTIAASAGFQGWHWMTKIGGLRVRTHRAAALVIADFDTVRADFNLSNARHVWLRYKTPSADPTDIAKAAQACYASVLGEEVRLGKPKRTRGDALMGSDGERGLRGRTAAYVEAVSADQVRRAIRGNASRWLWAASVMPLVAVAIGSIGMLTVVISSVRARQWEMGVLRALGFSRGTLVRLVVAEGLLVGVVACVLSLGFGIMAGWCGTGLSGYMSFFGGLEPVLVVPPAALGIGLMVVLLFAALAAIGPAVRVGRTHPLELLQQGRSAL